MGPAEDKEGSRASAGFRMQVPLIQNLRAPVRRGPIAEQSSLCDFFIFSAGKRCDVARFCRREKENEEKLPPDDLFLADYFGTVEPIFVQRGVMAGSTRDNRGRHLEAQRDGDIDGPVRADGQDNTEVRSIWGNGCVGGALGRRASCIDERHTPPTERPRGVFVTG